MSMSYQLDRKHKKTLAVYIYTNERGDPVYEIVRYEPKDFRIRYKDREGTYVWKKPSTIYPYKVHEVLLATKDEIVFIVEGEKDVETLRHHRLIGTTNPFGQGPDKWKKDWSRFFKGKQVVCIPDNDNVGREHMDRVSNMLASDGVNVSILNLPLPEGKKDVTDWLSIKGNKTEDLVFLARAAQKTGAVKPLGKVSDDYPEYACGDSWEGPKETGPQQEAEEEEEVSAKTPWVPFPLHCLPQVVRDYVEAGAQALNCDPAYVALPALVMLGGIIGNSRVIELKKTWQEPSVFWGVVIAESSTLKSPALDAAVLPAFQIQEELYNLYAQEHDEWKNDMEVWKASGGKAEGSKEYASKPAPVKPEPGRIIVNDITIEKLADLVHKNPRGLLLKRDELAGWFNSFGRYKTSGGGSDVPFWLEIFRAKAMTIDRKTGDFPTLYVPRFAVSVTGTIQPTVIRNVLTADFFESGLTSRLLLIKPPKAKKVWTEAVIPLQVEQSFFQLVRDLHSLIGKEKEAGHSWPKPLHFTPEGKSRWIEFYSTWADRQIEAEGEKAYALAKLEAYCARFALLLTVVEFFAGEITTEEISSIQVLKAKEMVEWFAYETERVYTLMKNPEDKVEEERLLDFITALGGEITTRRLLRSNPAKYRTSKACESILDGLVAKELGRWESRKAEDSLGGRPAKTFVLHLD